MGNVCTCSSKQGLSDEANDPESKKNLNSKDNDKLSEYQDKEPEEERWKITFDRHHVFIVDRMSPDFGLIDKLYANSAITENKKEEIEAEHVVHNRNENLIKCLGRNLRLRMLIQALRESDQKHLVKYLENDGNYSDEFDGEWPLTEKEILKIKGNYESLIDLIETSDLPDRLYSTGVINKRQREFISSKSTSYEKNKALLEILRRGSLHFYWQTIKCLQQSNQSHIAEILEKGGVAVPVAASLEMESMDIGKLEEEIALQINSLLCDMSIPQSSLIWDRVLKLKLIAAKKGHSVALYFLCRLLNEVDYLEKLATDGQLKEFTEDLFNHLIKTQETIKITLKWTPDVFDKCREAIEDMKNSGILQISRSMENLSLRNFQQGPSVEDNDAGSVVRYEGTEEVAIVDNEIGVPCDPTQTFDDSSKFREGERFFIVGMKLHTRLWEDKMMIGAMEVFYNTGLSVVHGSINPDTAVNDAEFRIAQNEYITEINVQSGWMLDRLTFATNKGNVHGPYGGEGGGQRRFVCPCEGAYLAYITGTVREDGGATSVRRLRFFWGVPEPAK